MLKSITVMAMAMDMGTAMGMESERILITGGAGFIGSNLVDYFIALGAHVRVLDNFSTGYKSNIEKHLSNPRFSLFDGDIRDVDHCKKAMKNITFVLHNAAVSSLIESFLKPSLITDVNVSGFLNILLAAKSAKVKRVVYASSSTVYGNTKTLPNTEEDKVNPATPYAVSKLTNELYAEVFSQTYGLECVGLRYFNAYGKKQDFNGMYTNVIPLFIKQLLNADTPLIYGSGNQSRDFIYIDDIVQMNELAMTTASHVAINTVYNTAYGQRVTLNELFTLLKEILKKNDPEIIRIKASHGPSREGDVLHSFANIKKANTLLGFKPIYDLNLGLNEMIKWYYQLNNKKY